MASPGPDDGEDDSDEEEWENGPASLAKALMAHVKTDSDFFMYPNKLRKSPVNSEVLLQYKSMLNDVIAAMGTRRCVSQKVGLAAFSLTYTMKGFNLSAQAKAKWEKEMSKRLRTALRHIFDAGHAFASEE
eukprot:6691272-Pyramimonas_sp.AAC.1